VKRTIGKICIVLAFVTSFGELAHLNGSMSDGITLLNALVNAIVYGLIAYFCLRQQDDDDNNES